MSRAALRIVAPNWKPKRPVVEWLSCDISYSLREYTTKMKDPLLPATAQMNLTSKMLSEGTHT